MFAGGRYGPTDGETFEGSHQVSPTHLERAFDASRRISVAARPSHTYPGPMGSALRRELKTHGWWIALSLASTIAVTVLFGLWLLPLYAPINIGGVWSVRHDLVSRRPRLQLALSVGAILLLPVGVLAPLFTKAGVTPAESISSASADETTRNETARASHARGPAGRQL